MFCGIDNISQIIPKYPHIHPECGNILWNIVKATEHYYGYE
jgi:hypothetical protein